MIITHTNIDVKVLTRAMTGRVLTMCPEADFPYIEAMTTVIRRFRGDSPSHPRSWDAGVD
jgi:hypothetical protein